MTVFTEAARAGNYIADEVSINLSRRQGVLASGSGVCLAGRVLAVVGGKYVPFDHAGDDGSEDAVAVLFDRIDATAADADCVVTADLTAVNGSELIWSAGIGDVAKAAAIAQLEALGITVLAADPIPSGS